MSAQNISLEHYTKKKGHDKRKREGTTEEKRDPGCLFGFTAQSNNQPRQQEEKMNGGIQLGPERMKLKSRRKMRWT